MGRFLFPLVLIITALSCTRPARQLDLQGHRGARGLFPENTLDAFAYAYSLPEVTTLELDVVVSADGKIIVSHEPWLNPDICLVDSAMVANNPRRFNIFKMTADSVKTFDCGSKANLRFPEQHSRPAYKPELWEVFALIAAESATQNKPWPNFNIETKTRPEGDGKFHPGPRVFMGLLASELRKAMAQYPEAELERKITIQSFDGRTLAALHNEFLGVKSCLLVEGAADPEKEMEAMGFAVDIYSPNYELVTPELLQWCHFRRINVIPWTVNEIEDMQRLVDMGVDGLISDYPNKFKELVY